jgi:uncharacterized protein
VRFDDLLIDDHILDKVEAKHGVTFEEVLEAVADPDLQVRRGREGLYRVFGCTDAGRYLLSVLASLGGGSWKVVTARDMTQQERRLYLR